MATGKVVGQIQVTKGTIKVVGVDGVVREPSYNGYMYENEQIVSNDPNALFQIKFLALPESSAYDGVFRILADGSVIHGRDAMDSMMSDENLVKVLETAAVKDVKTAGEDIGDLETAAGEEGAVGSSSFTETDIVAQSSVLGFSRGANGALGFGITDFGSVPNYDAAQIAPPAITSPNVVVYDENGTEPVIQITATAEGSVTYSISGLDSDKFSIDPASGVVVFNESPDYENPLDLSGDNEYNMYVTATDTFGNYTTQLLSVSVNNVNEAVTAFDDTVDAVEDTILSSTIDLDANDTDLDSNPLSVAAGTYTTAQGGTIVIAADGSYTYTPAANFNGTDTVNYTVTDGEFSDVGTLTINVVPANDAPTAEATTAAVDEDATVNGTIPAADVDGTVSMAVTAGNPVPAGLTLNSDGTFSFDASSYDYLAVGATQQYVVPVTVTDNNNAVANTTLTITITGTNDAPTAVVDSGTAAEDGSVVINVVANDTDLDGTIDPTTVTIITDPTNGTVSVNPTTGAVTYTPDADYVGPDSFSYTVQDNSGATSSSAIVSLSVTPVASAPIVDVNADVENPTISDYKEFTITDYRPIINSGTTTGILEFEGYARSASMNIKSFDGRAGYDAGIIELIKDGQVIKTYSLNDYFTGNPSESTGKLLTFTSDIYFNEVRVSNTSTNDQFKVENVALVSPYMITYNIEANAELTDSSEILSNLIVKVPSFLDGILIVNGVAPDAVLSANGDYNYYSIPATDPVVQLIFDHEVSTEWESAIDSITGSATSWESGDGFALSATSSDDMIAGTLGDDSISGEGGNDVIFGGAGTDAVQGNDGNDTLAGEAGDDTIDGGAGADSIYGGAGNDTLMGGEDDDYIDGGVGNDTIDGGAGNDTIVYDIADTEIDGGLGADTLIANSGSVDLSNVSGIEVIQLGSGATVVGSGVDGINANDVMNATDVDNTLIIQSVDENTNTINIDTASLPFSGNVDGYDIYTNGSVILQVEDDIEVI